MIPALLNTAKRRLDDSGIEPHKPGTAMNPYTIPTLKMADGSYVMDSKMIAEQLEKLYPEPSGFIDDPVRVRVEDALNRAFGSLRAELVPRMPNECLTEPTASFHRNARRYTFGMTLEELQAKAGGEKAWENAQAPLQEMAEILKENAEGPYCLGKTPSYADFYIAGVLEWCKLLGGDCLQRMYAVDPAFEALYEACRPWMVRNDH